MDKNYLLTYDFDYQSDRQLGYAWFETEKELREFIKYLKSANNTFSINEVLKINSAEEIEI